ncbi:hypothetical protein HYPSUDRAFT_295727 [Hypholoma sublateritium FD-334 SS-4]|uniref:Uncharacterized protein n=1 Tax=Hypholoma sublateritium (strain FD-334 SS-4) TaxID=945553 RepID=A0A0D2NIA7_HYPSF|nr:hypothetical protein HYPSUDRAFT_295727 [Hypholoma sublateritium FD-334 SS-4]
MRHIRMGRVACCGRVSVAAALFTLMRHSWKLSTFLRTLRSLLLDRHQLFACTLSYPGGHQLYAVISMPRRQYLRAV